MEQITESAVTFIIKTFERPEAVKRLVESIRKYYPTVLIYIANDGKSEVKFTSDLNVKVFNLRYDVGLSYGRNYMVERVKTKYFLLLDDDFIFTDATDISKMIYLLEKYDLDILGGLVNNESYAGMLSEPSSGSVVITSIRSSSESEITNSDIIMNFFIAKTFTFHNQQIRWDDELKLGEHTLFFYNIWKYHNVKIALTNLVKVFNKNTSNNPSYQKMRNRALTFYKKGLTKYKLNNIKRI